MTLHSCRARTRALPRRIPTHRLAVAAVTVGLSLPSGARAQRAAAGELPRMFETSDRCIACHNGVTAPSGEDVSIGSGWRASMMANSARDPYWQATVNREILDHPGAAEEIQNECSTCHMPMASYPVHAAGSRSGVLRHLPAVRGDADARTPTESDLMAADGVSCSVCHQIQPDRLGTEESFVGGFVVDTSRAEGDRTVYGPFDVDDGRTRVMHSASSFRPAAGTHIQQSELCATCHTLYTHALNDEDEIVGRLPEQVPFLEWQHSDYRDEQSCQSCHMPVVREAVPVTSVLGQPRDSVNRHTFRGGNFFLIRMLNRYRTELGVRALPQELDAGAARTIEHLQTNSARIDIEQAILLGERLEATVSVLNLAGHKLPTAYPSRRVWLHVTVRDRDDRAVFESGAFRADGSIAGNDNDADPTAYEPHHETIQSEDEVQIYESVMADYQGNLTTGVTTGLRYVKDNRVLPRGFDKSTAGEDIAVHGAAGADADFVGSSDRVRYSIDVSGIPGPYRIDVELWYQPVSYRWAQNLRTQDAEEIRRFTSWYDTMAASSAVVLTQAWTTVGGR